MYGGKITISFTLQLKAHDVADFQCAAHTIQHRMSMVLPSKTILCWPYEHEEIPSKVELIAVTHHPLDL